MQSDIISLIIIIVCIVMSGYFSATETAFSSLNRIRMKNMAEKGDKRAKLVLDLSENYDSLLSTILIGNNVVNIASASLATVLFVKLLGENVGPGISTIVTTVVVLIFAEVSPKSIAKEMPEKFAMFSAPFLKLLVLILHPFSVLFMKWKKLLSLIIKSEESHSMTEEELLTIVEEAHQEGGIDDQETTLIRSAIEFSEIEAIDILTPRVDIEGVSDEASKEEIAAVFAKTGYSRLPLYKDTIDQIIGILYQKDFHNYVYNTEQEISSIVRPVVFITKNKKIDELLKELQHKKSHIAVVVDEYGGTVGIVTLEDILEELVGEIWDEHDEITHSIEKMSNIDYIVSGSANIQDLFEILGKKEETKVFTVSGWVMDMLERIPVKGDYFQYQDLQVKVLEMDGKRVKKIHILIDKNYEKD